MFVGSGIVTRDDGDRDEDPAGVVCSGSENPQGRGFLVSCTGGEKCRKRRNLNGGCLGIKCCKFV